MAKDIPPYNDADLFRSQMKGVKPLKAAERIQPEKPRLSPRRRTPTASDDIVSSFAETSHAAHVGPEESLFFARTGLQQRLVKQLKRGDITVEASLDLHGETIEEAGKSLTLILDEAQSIGVRCVMVIHGKGTRSSEGRPVLKTQVNHWLLNSPAVLAFCTTQPRHGGSGSVYVLLKKRPGSEAEKVNPQ
jgi:DNA-nicking Smr family endonuclease